MVSVLSSPRRLVWTWLILATAFLISRTGLSYLVFGSVQSTSEVWAHLALIPLFQALFEQARERLSDSRLQAAIRAAARRPLPATLLVADCGLLVLAILGGEWADPAHGSIGSYYFAGKALLAGGWLLWRTTDGKMFYFRPDQGSRRQAGKQQDWKLSDGGCEPGWELRRLRN